MEKIGVLHPGEMGISIAASALNSGQAVFWASQGRGPKTRARAEEHGLVDLETLAALGETCTLIISVCPPHAAEAVAHQVRETAFSGLYVDANAISPQRAERIGRALSGHGIGFVDGGIIGGPAWTPGETWLYLSGPQAGQAAACFSAGPLQTELLGETIGRASALKMCYAAWSKGTTALLAAVTAAAESQGLRAELDRQWQRDDPAFPGQAARRVTRVTRKAWRFAGEMDEIAATFAAAGLPDGFHRAAAELYASLAGFKDRAGEPPLAEVLAALLHRGSQSP